MAGPRGQHLAAHGHVTPIPAPSRRPAKAGCGDTVDCHGAAFARGKDAECHIDANTIGTGPMTRLVLEFSVPAAVDTQLTGGKGASLARLTLGHFPVPSGVIVAAS